MTLNTFEVAVCCSNNSRSSLSRRNAAAQMNEWSGRIWPLELKAATMAPAAYNVLVALAERRALM